MRKNRLCLVSGYFVLLMLLIMPLRANAQQEGLTIIRDAEIEEIIKSWTSPIIKSAGLSQENVKIILVQNSQVNAFVAGGSNIFIYTGIFEKADNAGEVVGVIAHEMGHISGGHLVRTREAYENASYESMLGAILGIGVAIATGEGGAGAAVSAGTQSMAARNFLSYSRIQESSADQAALTYLDNAGIGSSGLLSFMKKLEGQEVLVDAQQSEYVRTHPLGRNRIDALSEGVSGSQAKGWPEQWDKDFAIIKAKLKSFINPQQVAWDYADNDKSLPARYARAIAAYRQSRIDEALSGADSLLGDEPENPYFLELKGQMLRDFGRLEEALPFYEKASVASSGNPLIDTDYAHILIETSERDSTRLQEAVRLLNKAEHEEKRSSRIHRLLATAYGRMGKEPLARLHLAEEALLQGKYDYAIHLAEGAIQSLEPGSKDYLRASDILNFAEMSEKGSDRR